MTPLAASSTSRLSPRSLGNPWLIQESLFVVGGSVTSHEICVHLRPSAVELGASPQRIFLRSLRLTEFCAHLCVPPRFKSGIARTLAPPNPPNRLPSLDRPTRASYICP